MKLEIKHLAPYLPYGLMIKVGLATTAEMTLNKNDRELVDISWVLNNDAYEPYLRHLSDLTKEIEHNGEKFVPIIELCLMREIMSKSTNRNIFTVGIEHGDKYVAHFHNHYFHIHATTKAALDVRHWVEYRLCSSGCCDGRHTSCATTLDYQATADAAF